MPQKKSRKNSRRAGKKTNASRKALKKRRLQRADRAQREAPDSDAGRRHAAERVLRYIMPDNVGGPHCPPPVPEP